MYWIILGLSFIFFMTMLGSLLSLFFKTDWLDNELILSFALGVMLSSGIFSLLIEAIRLSNQILNYFPLIFGIIIGAGIIILIPILIKKENDDKKRLFLAMTIHNIPEGFSVGLSLFIAYMSNDREIMLNAIMLFIAIGIQNIPEGFAVSLPYKIEEGNKKGILVGFISSVVEPIAGLLALIFVFIGNMIEIYGMAIGAGAMIMTVLIEMKDKFNLKGLISFSVGFLIMTLLDLLL